MLPAAEDIINAVLGVNADKQLHLGLKAIPILNYYVQWCSNILPKINKKSNRAKYLSVWFEDMDLKSLPRKKLLSA